MSGNNSKSKQQAAKKPDCLLLTSVFVLIGLGLIMVLSASAVVAEKMRGDSLYFFERQALFACLGLGAMFVSWRLPLKLFYQTVYLWLFAALLLLALTLTPLGVQAGGAKRWLPLAVFTFQPLELAKVALVLYLAYFFSHKQDKVKTFSVGFLPPLIITGFMAAILLLQPDFGGAMFITSLFFLLSMVAGTRLVYLFSSFLLTMAAGIALVLESPYRIKRWVAFLHPFEDANEAGYQVVQSLYGLGAGGLFGQGLGAGKQKLFFLPAAHTDFILAVLGEELGFVGLCLVFICFGLLMFSIFRISLTQTSLQDRFTALGLGLVILIGALLHSAVVMGAVPPKGLPMPFMSYGGSSMLISCFCIGLLLNIGQRGSK